MKTYSNDSFRLVMLAFGYRLAFYEIFFSNFVANRYMGNFISFDCFQIEERN